MWRGVRVARAAPCCILLARLRRPWNVPNPGRTISLQADLSHRRAVTTEEGEQFAKVGSGAWAVALALGVG